MHAGKKPQQGKPNKKRRKYRLLQAKLLAEADPHVGELRLSPHCSFFFFFFFLAGRRGVLTTTPEQVEALTIAMITDRGGLVGVCVSLVGNHINDHFGRNLHSCHMGHGLE